MLKNRHSVATCLLLALAMTMPASAGIRSASFGVSVRVVARTWIEPVDEPATIVLTHTDLEQGFKQLDVRYRVHTTGTSRYLLNIAPRTGFTDRIHIDGLGGAVEVGDLDISVNKEAQSNIDELRLHFRLDLRSGLAAGDYPMPVRLSVSAS